MLALRPDRNGRGLSPFQSISAPKAANTELNTVALRKGVDAKASAKGIC